MTSILEPEVMLLQGTWRSCIYNPPNSGLVIFTFTDNQITETISEWDDLGCTLIKFKGKNYNSFNPSDIQPDCNPSKRGTGINSAMTFIKD